MQTWRERKNAHDRILDRAAVVVVEGLSDDLSERLTVDVDVLDRGRGRSWGTFSYLSWKNLAGADVFQGRLARGL